MSSRIADGGKDLPPGVPPALSQHDVDQVSKDQALIADEWAPAPPHPDGADDDATPSDGGSPD